MKDRLALGAALAALAFATIYAVTSVPIYRSLPPANSAARLPSYPPAIGGPDSVQPIPNLAERRKAILDSADLYATVSLITTHSSTVDKLAASEALTACAELRPKRKREAGQVTAVQELAARCTGIHKHLRHDGAVERAIELRESAERDASPLGGLVALSRRAHSHVRWQAEDFQIVSDALKSNDLVRVDAAISALHIHLDDGSPDSKLRALAFSYAAEFHRTAVGQQAAFDRLAHCANADRCEQGDTVATSRGVAASYGTRERLEIEDLTEQYRLALQRGKTATEVLRIR
jgi:hypothetical protein